MSVKFEGVETKRGELLYLKPEDLVLAEEGKGGRLHEIPQAKVEEKAISILRHGQLQPIRIRKTEDGKPAVVVGTTRVRALLLINSGWLPPYLEADDEATSLARDVHSAKLPVLVSCEYTKSTAETALLESIEENRQRNATTPLDDLHNMNRLRDELGYTDEQIAEVYQCTVPWVQQLRKLNEVAAEVRDAVSRGDMSAAAAVELAVLPTKTEQRQALKELEQEADDKAAKKAAKKKPTEKTARKKASKKAAKPKKKKAPKISAADVKKKTRQARIAAGKSGGNRSVKEIKAFFGRLSDKGEPMLLRSVCSVVAKYAAGQVNEEVAEKSLRSKLKD